MRPLCLMVGVLLAGVSVPALAAGGAWDVGKVTGHAWMQSPSTQPVDLAAGATVPEGMTVFTDPRARVMLVRGQETMLVGPKSVMAVGPGAAPGLDTTIVQQVGSVTFEVAKLDHPHFSVETPMLAAVVKGTHFTVQVTGKRADVAVARGLVNVTGLATGESADISPGQRAAVTNGPHGGMSVGGPRGATPSISQGRPRAAMVSTVAAAAAAETARAAAGAAAAAGNDAAAASAAAGATATASPAAAATASASASATSGNGASSGNSDSSFRAAQASFATAVTSSMGTNAAAAGPVAGLASGPTSTAAFGEATSPAGIGAGSGATMIGVGPRTVSLGSFTVAPGPAAPGGPAGPKNGLGPATAPAGGPGAPAPAGPAGPGGPGAPHPAGLGAGLGGLVGQIGQVVGSIVAHGPPAPPHPGLGFPGLGGLPGGLSVHGLVGAAQGMSQAVRGSGSR